MTGHEWDYKRLGILHLVGHVGPAGYLGAHRHRSATCCFGRRMVTSVDVCSQMYTRICELWVDADTKQHSCLLSVVVSVVRGELQRQRAKAGFYR